MRCSQHRSQGWCLFVSLLPIKVIQKFMSIQICSIKLIYFIFFAKYFHIFISVRHFLPFLGQGNQGSRFLDFCNYPHASLTLQLWALNLIFTKHHLTFTTSQITVNQLILPATLRYSRMYTLIHYFILLSIFLRISNCLAWLSKSIFICSSSSRSIF